MAQLIAEQRDIDFVLYEQLGAGELEKTERYKGQNKKMYDMIAKEARNLAIKEILPLNEEGDRQGLKFENNQVIVPEGGRRVLKMLQEGEYMAMSEDPEVGGLGLPHVINQMAKEYIVGADFSSSAICIGCHGAGKMIEEFGTEQQKDTYLRNLYSGKWSGTMVLTESEAGSDVGGLSTTAVKNGDGSYHITGNKIFISGGEHDLTENIVHPVLARIEGAPAGSKGISIFIVPKFRVNDDGSPGEHNDVVCTGIEEKMGLHASPTCQLTFGGKGNCRGYLLGEENKGMRVMFRMMNEARVDVGAVGLYNGSSAYLYAVNYARERVQGRDLADMLDNSAPPVPIIRHPDVRRMLMWMKSHVEGMRSFVYYLGLQFDKIACSDNEEEKTAMHDLVELLTPVLKSYCTDRGFECTVQAMQVYGGYGYTKDYPIERLMRDSKINSIYEGTNGIQAMDLLGRKLGMKKGMVFMNFIGEIKKITAEAKSAGLIDLARWLDAAVDRLGETAMHMGKTAMSPEFKTAFSFALPFLDTMGDVIMGWMLLWRATVAKPALEKLTDGLDAEARIEKIKKNKNAAFYEGQLKSAEYFIKAILPGTIGKMSAIEIGSDSVVNIEETAFGGK